MQTFSLQTAVSEVVTGTNSVTNTKADVKIAKVIESWSFDSNYQAFIKSLIEGTTVDYIESKRIYSTAKVGMKFVGSRDDRPFGYMGFISTDRIDIPVEWLDYSFLSMLDIVIKDGQDDSKISWWRWDAKSESLVSAKSLMGSSGMNKHIIKLMMMAKDSSTRRMWSSRIGSLQLFPDYRINCTTFGTIPGSCQIPTKHTALIKEEHANKGFFNTVMPDSVFAHNVSEGIMSIEDPKKALARISRLVQHPDAVDMGTFKFFVADDIPEELTEWFFTGSGYCPTSLLGRVGGFRAVNEYGLKITSMLYPESWVDSVADDCFIVSKASFKSGLNGVLKLLSGASNKRIADGDSDKMMDFLLSKIECITLDGHDVNGWYVDMPLHITSFYSLYGLRTIEEIEEGLGDDEVCDDGLVLPKGSFYTSSLEALTADPDYDLLYGVQAMLDKKEIRYMGQKVRIKVQELNTSYWTHGADVSDQFMKNVVDSSFKYMKAAGKLGLDTMSDADIDVVAFDAVFLNELAYKVYPAGLRSNPGVLDPSIYRSIAEGNSCIDLLLNGIEGTLWDGIFGISSKVFVINGKEFFIPSGSVMKEYAFTEEGSDRWFMSGPAKALQTLMVSIKNVNTNWDIKSVNHNMDLQSSLYGDTVDNFPVKGFGNKAMLPAPWLDADEVTVLDKTYKGHNGEHVMGSKMPVLFDTAVSGFKLLTGLPRHIFGEIDDRLRLALRNMVFINCDVMMDLRNDTDGDMHRIALVSGIPLHTGVPEHMRVWRDSYIADESDMKCTLKGHKFYNMDSVNDSVLEAAENKEYVGKATNALATLGHILQILISKGLIEYSKAKLIRASYAMSMQDYIVAGIKHATFGSLFKDADLNAAFYSVNEEVRFNSRRLFVLLISEYNDTVGAHIYIMFTEWDLISGMSNGTSPLSKRRTSVITGHDYRQVPDEHLIKQLDMFTRSYLRNSYLAQPVFSMANSKDDKVREAFALCLASLSSYESKTVLWEQVLPSCDNTVISRLLNYWKEVSNMS